MKDERYVQHMIADIAGTYAALESQEIVAYYQLDEMSALMVGYIREEERYTLYRIAARAMSEGIAVEKIGFSEYAKIAMPQMIEMLRKIDNLEKALASREG